MSPAVNLVVVGDTRCGKTSLLTSFLKTRQPGEETPNFDDYVTTGLEIDGELVALELRDTVSSEACRRFRLFWYMGSHVILLCFSIDSPSSLKNVPDDWMPELRRICPDVPVILVGNKLDLRMDRCNQVQTEEGRAMSANISAKAYFECSAVTGEGVRQLFDAAARAGLENLKRFFLDTLSSCKQQLDICIHLMTAREISQVILKCHERGVKIRIICDSEFATNIGSQIQFLMAHGMEVKVPEISFNMHNKFAIIDRCKLMSGSVNWTVQGFYGNWDNLVVTTQRGIVRDAVAAFERMWNHPDIRVPRGSHV